MKILSIENLTNFIQGYYNYFRNYLDNESLPKHIREQALWRAMQCVECLNNNKCTECRCATPAMFFSPLKEDSLGRWGKMLEEEEWDSFKLDNSIKIISNFEEIMYSEIIKKYQFKVLKPEWFVYKGANCFHRMNPSFLIVLDEILLRADIIDFNSIVMSWRESSNPMNRFNGKAVKLEILSSVDTFDVIREAITLGMSIEIQDKQLIIFENPIQIFILNG